MSDCGELAASMGYYVTLHIRHAVISEDAVENVLLLEFNIVV